ncbi:glutamate synthase-related protein [Thalassolituus sp.]|uniref:glutamate synthase-related protein n=1 Tax=Thalassolituus sp. TaxID=2030822 RepID=UPI003517A498
MRYLFDRELDYSSCGVGFITNKHSEQTHELLEHAHQSLCMIPHRGGFNAEGIGDGAGVNVDISLNFYRYLTGDDTLQLGEFGVANFFYPRDVEQHGEAEKILRETFAQHKLDIILWRDVAVNPDVLGEVSAAAQLVIHQLVFARPAHIDNQVAFEELIHEALEDIEYPAFSRPELEGFYPLSMSSRTQVFKGRLNSWEVVPYFQDLNHKEHKIHTLFFHTRFSTNTAPNPMFAQPFRRMAHNGELNTDRKNRLSEDAIARSHGKEIVFPKGQSDSARLDQTMARRVIEDRLEIDTAALVMMPPAWENDDRLSQPVRDMLEYFSLYEEKNDGPAALIFGDGVRVGARLDRLGLRPLRTVETDDYLAVMSEAGQIDFPAESVIRRGRVEAGGMVIFDHARKKIEYTNDVLERLAQQEDYSKKLADAHLTLSDLPEANIADVVVDSSLNVSARHVAYSLNQESFKFMLDPMLQTGMEKISAMGYGLAPNALARDEGGVSRYFSQRFAQVTNPPLDSIREADGMTLRVALGRKPNFSDGTTRQLVLRSPIIQPQELLQIEQAQKNGQPLRVARVECLYEPDFHNDEQNTDNLLTALRRVCEEVEALARNQWDIIILSDAKVSHRQAAIPALLAVSAANQRLIRQGVRFNSSLVAETGQASSTHDIACLLGFGASAVCPLSVFYRAQELFSDNDGVAKGLNYFQKAVEKALMKTMGKFGLCTAESYIGGEFFEANFIDTQDPILHRIFPNIHSPVGGAGFGDIASNATEWHRKVSDIQSESEIPLLGLFKERADGSGHSFGTTAVREFINMTEEDIRYAEGGIEEHPIRTPDDDGYRKLGYEACTPEQIDNFEITPAYRAFCDEIYRERNARPAALRDVLALPVDLSACTTREEFVERLSELSPLENAKCAIQGIQVETRSDNTYIVNFVSGSKKKSRYQALADALQEVFDAYEMDPSITPAGLKLDATGTALEFLSKLIAVPTALNLDQVQPAHEITPTFASGAMSHGALVARAHEAVAQGTNIAGAMSNSGEGGEHSRRYNTVKASKIKQFASGRFGVWVGYLADPALQEIEIKIAQGAKPGEGGQLPSAKVNVEIAAARGGTPGVELVSPPPHHDTYSIEDLGQLIHDAKAARVRVIVKLVSSEGVGTIAVGVAKAGANVINIAGNTGGTGAAQVTSLKNTGRAAEIGIAEVHTALAENGLRDRVILRCSGAHQTGLDVIKSAMLGGDSFEFGTTALMMLKCVMAKNCNVKCPAGLTTNPEVYEGDPRALAQYFINLAHEVRELLARIGFSSLREIRGRSDLLHLVKHPEMNGRLDMTGLLSPAVPQILPDAVALEADFTPDDAFIEQALERFFTHSVNNHSVDNDSLASFDIEGPDLNNCNKTTGGQFAIDVERHLNYVMTDAQRQAHPAVDTLANGRVILRDDSLRVRTYKSAGQSFGAFNNSGISLHHSGTCNDGVGKGASGGRIIVTNPGGGADDVEGNVLVGNFALFGATGGELFVEGQAGDRFGVRNSGAVAVVEGVGDFCCEYMTNGCIVNLGGYGKGFGNGMSGGTAYQYDPAGAIADRCSKDSVKATCIADDSELMRGMETALHLHLQAHVRETGSALAQSLLDNWSDSRQHFYVLIPLALYNYHCGGAILAKQDRKSMLEELSVGWGTWHLRRIAKSYRDGTDMFAGRIPGYGDCDTDLICRYSNAMGILRRALELAEKSDLVKSGDVDADEMARHLIVSEDRKLLEQLFKDIKQALADFSDNALAALLADKRVRDYKESLALREVWDTRALSTSVWIMARDRENQQELADYPALEQALAAIYVDVLANAMVGAA